jgi:hypothetical protein
MADPTFKSLFCEKFRCPPEAYEERAFQKLLYWHARFLASLVRTISPSYFLEDFTFIRYLGYASNRRQTKVDCLEFNESQHKHWRLLHTSLKIRVSGRKALRLAFQLFRESRQTDFAARSANVVPTGAAGNPAAGLSHT